MSVSLKQSYDIEYDGTANVARMDLFADTAADLTGLTTFDSITLLQGSTVIDISTGDVYMMQTGGTWVKQPSQSAFANVYTKAEIDSMLYLYYTKTEADALFEWITVTITTDTLPLSFIADGTPLISWSMKGNGSQQGTPTPDNPITPEFVGVRTWNIVNPADMLDGYFINASGVIAESPRRTTTPIIPVNGTSMILTYTTTTLDSVFAIYALFSNGTMTARIAGDLSGTVIDISQSDSICVSFYSANSQVYVRSADMQVQLAYGSTALPYEQFGYKIPISCGGETTPVYLGEVPTVRRIEKFVLDGTEYWSKGNYPPTGGYQFFTSKPSGILDPPRSWIITHFKAGSGLNGSSFSTYLSLFPESSILPENATINDFKAWLAAQYANGTPVTLWYVLSEPETAIVNEPLCKIGNYADELSSTDAAVTIPTAKGQNTLTVDTPIQPSEMTITGKIREVTENEQ